MLYLVIFNQQFCRAMIDSTEKYLFEYNHINPFYALFFEGLFGFILSLIYGLSENPIYYIEIYQKMKSTKQFSVLIVLFVLYIILSGFKNAFRVQSTKIYSPMTTTFMDYILNPIYLIIYFALNEDFLTKRKRNYAHFFINLFLALFITFLGFIYNDFIIIYCFGLERDTYQEVSKRGALIDKNANEFLAMYELEEGE